MKRVVIFQYRLLHYRTELFERLRRRCAERGISLELVVGQPTRRESAKRDTGKLSWTTSVVNRVWEVGARDLVWQPFPAQFIDSDLVIVMQESRILSNYPLLLSRLWSKRKLAYWGHGVNFQSTAPSGLREQWKRLMLTPVDWWFAYTSISADIAKKNGYPGDRISVLDNAIDNEGFRADLADVTDADLTKVRAELRISPGEPTGLFCGSLYIDKRLDFMIQAADRIRDAVPNFSLIVVGDGPLAAEVHAAAATRPWMHCVGVKKGKDKAAYFKLATLVFNPGAVGLHILDSFCAGVPMATTSDARHGPEIAYLEHGDNGIKTLGKVEDYSTAVVELLRDESLYSRIQKAALAAAERYSLDNMVNQFCDGIEQCIAAPKKR